MADLPKLNDARRVARLTMVLDELLNAKDADEPFTMSYIEFKMCGGHVNDIQKKYSLYRQLVYATRDLKAYLRRGSLPSCHAVQKANKWYIFHDTKIRLKESEDDSMKTKDFNRILRMLLILQKFRKHMSKSSTHRDVKKLLDSFHLSYQDFLLCGGKIIRGKKDKTAMRFDLDKQLRYVIEDLRDFMTRGKMYPPCVLAKAQRHIALKNEFDINAYIDSSGDEEVDDLDGGPASTCFSEDVNVFTYHGHDEDEDEDDGEEEEIDDNFGKDTCSSSPQKLSSHTNSSDGDKQDCEDEGDDDFDESEHPFKKSTRDSVTNTNWYDEEEEDCELVD